MKRSLYLGLDPAHYLCPNHIIHFPVIRIEPRNFDDPSITHVFEDMASYTHVVFTSKSAVKIFWEALEHFQIDPKLLQEKKILAVGKVTEAHLIRKGIRKITVAQEETQEGVIAEVLQEDFDRSYFLLPCSSLSRPKLGQFFMLQRIRHQLCYLYDTVINRPKNLPDLREVDEIIFTSPSTVDAFVELFQTVPSGIKLTPVGPVTEEKLQKVL